MKVERIKVFEKVTITLESPEEVRFLKACVNISTQTIIEKNNYSKHSQIMSEELEKLQAFTTELWADL